MTDDGKLDVDRLYRRLERESSEVVLGHKRVTSPSASNVPCDPKATRAAGTTERNARVCHVALPACLGGRASVPRTHLAEALRTPSPPSAWQAKSPPQQFSESIRPSWAEIPCTRGIASEVVTSVDRGRRLQSTRAEAWALHSNLAAAHRASLLPQHRLGRCRKGPGQ